MNQSHSLYSVVLQPPLQIVNVVLVVLLWQALGLRIGCSKSAHVLKASYNTLEVIRFFSVPIVNILRGERL